MPVDPNRVQAVFLLAVDFADPTARAAFLDRECAGDAGLRRRVESLLRANDRPGGFLDRPFIGSPVPLGVEVLGGDGDAQAGFHAAIALDGALAAPGGPTPAPGIGVLCKRIGPYKLLEKIGEGGMGAVYMAEQEEPVRRRVALKIIKPGMDSEQVVARFEAERQTLALMDHQNIARVLDAGTTGDGRPFFVMELVCGEAITSYCGRRRLATRDRLELFVSVCNAVHHAHQNGIIHRDVKPSNILVAHCDGKPVPKVIDFGVAKAIEQRLTERTLFTRHGAVVGTFEYMSPEQAEMSALGVDTRSDIYSLGVLLYELLTGTTPLERRELIGLPYSDILRRIRDEEPPRPSARLKGSRDSAPCQPDPEGLTGLMRGELDWIVMRALEKDRARRYETAFAFARDVRRFLDGEFVEACPPSLGYRLRKFARRNRAALLAIAAVAAVLAAGAAVGVRQAIRAIRAEAAAVLQAERATAAEERARLERDRALAAEAQAKAEGEKARRSAAESSSVLRFFEDHILSAARPEGMERAIGKDATIRQALDAAEPKIAGAFPGQPGVEAAVRTVLGDTYYYLGEPAVAARQRERALDLRTAALGPDHPDALKSATSLALAYWAAGQVDRAIPLLERTLPAQEAGLGPDHPDTLTSRNHLALLYQAVSAFDRSIALLEQTVRARRATLGADHPDTLLSQSYLANTYRVAGRPDRALPLIERTVASQTSRLGADHPDVVTARNTLANVYRDLGRHDKAASIAEQTLALGEPKLGAEHPRLQITLSLLAMVYQASGRWDRAIPLFERSAAVQSARLGPDHPETLSTRTRLASAYRDAGRYDLALPILQEVVPALKEKMGPENIRTLIATSILADAWRCAGETDRAIALLEQNLVALSSRLGEDHAETLLAQDYLARAYFDARRPERSLPLLERNLAMRTAKLGADHPASLATRVDLGEALQLRGDSSRAESMLREAHAAFVKRPGPDHPDAARALAALARGLMRSREWAEAERLLVKALAILDEHYPDHWLRFDARSLLGESLIGQGRLAEAEPHLVAGLEGLVSYKERIPASRRACVVEAGERASKLYEALGDLEKAEASQARPVPPATAPEDRSPRSSQERSTGGRRPLAPDVVRAASAAS